MKLEIFEFKKIETDRAIYKLSAILFRNFRANHDEN